MKHEISNALASACGLGIKWSSLQLVGCKLPLHQFTFSVLDVSKLLACTNSVISGRLGFWKGFFIFSRCYMQGSGAQPPATDKAYAFKSMQSDEIRHNSAINMMTVGVALTLLKIPELWMQTRFKLIYCTYIAR